MEVSRAVYTVPEALWLVQDIGKRERGVGNEGEGVGNEGEGVGNEGAK